jgi:serine-type D-Ala-D-Ala carboxypeptidase (penicillin-binding protein 5/6)
MLPRFLALVLAFPMLALAQTPQPPQAVGRAWVLADVSSGQILAAEKADERFEPASLTKLMTAYVVFAALKEKKLKLEQQVSVSERAWRAPGSRMFIEPRKPVTADELIRGMIVQSGNDACYVLAEGLAGSMDVFIARMNEIAQQLGLAHSHFANVDGLPDPQEYVTARDLATLAHHLIADYPEYYHYESEKDFTYNGIKQGNRNPLLYKDIGVDGIKTGHTEEAGYGVTISALRDGRRIIEVLAGMSSMKERSNESEKMLEWAFREFNDYRLVKAGEAVDDAPVWLGEAPKVQATTKADIYVTLPRKARRDLKVTAVYDAAVKAPVAQGQTVGRLVVSAPDMDAQEFPLVAAQPVAKLNPLGRVAAAAGYFLWGKR